MMEAALACSRLSARVSSFLFVFVTATSACGGKSSRGDSSQGSEPADGGNGPHSGGSGTAGTSGTMASPGGAEPVGGTGGVGGQSSHSAGSPSEQPGGPPAISACMPYSRSVLARGLVSEACALCNSESACASRASLGAGECSSSVRCVKQFCGCSEPDCGPQFCDCLESCVRQDLREQCSKSWQEHLNCVRDECAEVCQ